MKQKEVSRSQDPLWDMTPELGVEGLIATIEDHDELVRALNTLGEDNKRKKVIL